MDFDKYLAIDAVNASLLKIIHSRSCLAAKHYLTEPQKETPALWLGRAAHTATLVPEKLADEFAVWDGDKRTKAGKLEWAGFLADNAHKTILTASEYDRAIAIGNAVRSHPVSGPLVESMIATEHTITWKDKRTGINCKCRLDAVSCVGSDCFFWDLKTARNIEPGLFSNQFARLAYHLQFAFYNRGASMEFGINADPKCVAVDPMPPHDVVVYSIDDLVLIGIEGDRAVDDSIDKYIECKRSGIWPGFAVDREIPLTLPAWAQSDDDLNLTFDGEALAL